MRFRPFRFASVTLAASLSIALLLPPAFAQTTEELFQQVVTAVGAEEYEQAESIARRIIQAEPNNSIGYYALGNTLFSQERFTEAVTAFEQGIELNPNNPSFYNSLAAVYGRQNNFEAAISSIQQAIELTPNAPNNQDFLNTLYTNLGSQHYALGDLDAALAAIQQAITINPDLPNAYDIRGNIQLEQADLDGAIASYERAIELNPNVPEGNIPNAETLLSGEYNNLANVYLEQGRVDDAISSYQQALSLDPDSTIAHYNLGYALVVQGNLDKGIASYQRSLAIDPDYVQAQSDLIEAQRLIALAQNNPPNSDRNWLPNDNPQLSIQRSVVRVVSQQTRGGSNIGTGWVVKRDRNTLWILTTRDTVSDRYGLRRANTDIEVEYYSEPPEGQVRLRQPARLLNITDRNDPINLALLRVSNPPGDIQALELSSQVTPDSVVTVVGHPVFGNSWSTESALIQSLTAQNLQLSQVRTEGGYEGAPILDGANRVIGTIAEVDLATDNSVSRTGTAADRGDSGSSYAGTLLQEKLAAWGIP